MSYCKSIHSQVQRGFRFEATACQKASFQCILIQSNTKGTTPCVFKYVCTTVLNIIQNHSPLTVGAVYYRPVIDLVLTKTWPLSYTQDKWKELYNESAQKHSMVLLVAKYLLLFVTHSPYQVPILRCSNFITLNIPDVCQVYCLIVGGVLQRGQSFTLALH